jgi:hypothetical protein
MQVLKTGALKNIYGANIVEAAREKRCPSSTLNLVDTAEKALDGLVIFLQFAVRHRRFEQAINICHCEGRLDNNGWC